jgi:hypothetical protein
MNQLVSPGWWKASTTALGLANFIRAGRITADQANALGRRPEERHYRLSASVPLPTWSTANATVTMRLVMAGNTVGVALSRSPA